MKKTTWIALSLAAALCMPLAGCAGDKTGGEIGTTEPTAQTTPTNTPDGVTGGDLGDGETNTDAANGGNNVSGAPVGDENARVGTTRGANANTGMGRADGSALERMGEGIKDTLDDMGSGARRMAQDVKRAME